MAPLGVDRNWLRQRLERRGAHDLHLSLARICVSVFSLFRRAHLLDPLQTRIVDLPKIPLHNFSEGRRSRGNRLLEGSQLPLHAFQAVEQAVEPRFDLGLLGRCRCQLVHEVSEAVSEPTVNVLLAVIAILADANIQRVLLVALSLYIGKELNQGVEQTRLERLPVRILE